MPWESFQIQGSGIRLILTLSPFQKELDRSGSTLPPACDLRASQSCSENHLCSYRFFTPPGFIGNRSTGSFFKRFSIRLRQFPLTTDLIQHTTKTQIQNKCHKSRFNLLQVRLRLWLTNKHTTKKNKVSQSNLRTSMSLLSTEPSPFPVRQM